MGATVTIRAATGEDVEAILRLANDQRHLYATYQPVFWRVAADAVAQHRPHLSALVDDAAITLVAATDQSLIGFAVGRLVPPPPVYDPGGVSCFIDDFAVADPADWLTAGVDLLRAVCQAARERGDWFSASGCSGISPVGDIELQLNVNRDQGRRHHHNRHRTECATRGSRHNLSRSWRCSPAGRGVF